MENLKTRGILQWMVVEILGCWSTITKQWHLSLLFCWWKCLENTQNFLTHNMLDWLCLGIQTLKKVIIISFLKRGIVLPLDRDEINSWHNFTLCRILVSCTQLKRSSTKPCCCCLSVFISKKFFLQRSLLKSKSRNGLTEE